MANDKTIAALQRVAAIMREALSTKIIEQGHDLTGSLRKDIRNEIVVSGATVTLDIFMRKYGIFVDRGVKASRIPYKRGSGKTESKYIDGLIDFVRKRGLATGDKEVKNIAFAIANKHKKEGMPTRASREHSKTGRRLNMIQEAIDLVVNKIVIEIAEGVLEDRVLIIDNEIRGIKKVI